MATWSEIQAHMRSNYVLQRDEPNVMGMTWAYTDGRSQKIVVRRFTSDGHEMVEFKSPFARVGDVDSEAMLRENGRLAFGAVAISGDVFIVIANSMLQYMPIEEFEVMVGRVAAAADHLESRTAGGDTF